jgi:hypothetical protein
MSCAHEPTCAAQPRDRTGCSAPGCPATAQAIPDRSCRHRSRTAHRRSHPGNLNSRRSRTRQAPDARQPSARSRSRIARTGEPPRQAGAPLFTARMPFMKLDSKLSGSSAARMARTQAAARAVCCCGMPISARPSITRPWAVSMTCGGPRAWVPEPHISLITSAVADL